MGQHGFEMQAFQFPGLSLTRIGWHRAVFPGIPEGVTASLRENLKASYIVWPPSVDTVKSLLRLSLEIMSLAGIKER